MKRKKMMVGFAAVLCLGLLAGCTTYENQTPSPSPAGQETPTISSDAPTTSDAYKKLVAFKVADYGEMSVADFNKSLSPDNDDISGLLDAQAEVVASILPDDENYEFFTVTLAASLEELYCEQMNDKVGFSDYLERKERPQETLAGEENIAGAETTYQFVFNALYHLHYTILSPDNLTVAERDSILQEFRTKYQSYVGYLNEEELSSSNIKTVLAEKGNELATTLSTTELALSCEVESVEVHNAGSEIVNN